MPTFEGHMQSALEANPLLGKDTRVCRTVEFDAPVPFSGELRDECLNVSWFANLFDAPLNQVRIETSHSAASSAIVIKPVCAGRAPVK
jgi:hypothetical protein